MKPSSLKPARGVYDKAEGGEGESTAKGMTNTSTSIFTRPHSVETMIAPYFRFWQACRRRRKRRKSSMRMQYKANNNKIKQTCGKTRTRTRFNVAATWPNDIFAKEKLRNMLISCETAGGVRRNCRNMQNEIQKATTTSALLGDYSANDMKQAQSSISLQATTTTKPKMKRVSVTTKRMMCMCGGASTTTKAITNTAATEATNSKLTKCAHPISERRKQQKQQQHISIPHISKLTTNTHKYLHSIIQQQQQTKQVSAASTPTLQIRLDADLRRSCWGVCATFPYQEPANKRLMQQQRYTQWLAAAAEAEQKRNSKQTAKQRSWRNLISRVVSEYMSNVTTTIAKATTTTNTTGTTNSTKTTTTPIKTAANNIRTTTTAEIALTNTAATATETIDTTTTATNTDSCSSFAVAANAKTSNRLTANAFDMRDMSIATNTSSVENNSATAKKTTTLIAFQQQQSQHVAEFVNAHKSNCRKTFALTSALVEAKKIHQTSAAPTSTRTTINTTNMRNTLARGKTPMVLFGDILTLLVGTLTLHTIV